MRFCRKKAPSLRFEDNFPIPRRRPSTLYEFIAGIIASIIGGTMTPETVIGISIGGTVYGLELTAIVEIAIIGAVLCYSFLSGQGGGKSSFIKNVDQNGQLVNTKQAGEPVKVAYGKIKVGGNWVACDPSRLNNNWLNVILTWSEGEIEGIEPAVDYCPLFNGSGSNDMKPGGDFTAPSCSCNATCYGYTVCSCNMTCYSQGPGKYPTCSCNATCYGYAPCTCNMSCYGYGNAHYKIQIDGTSSPNTFKWSDDGGGSWDATGVGITKAWQTLNNGVKVIFESDENHVSADSWDFWAGEGVFLGERLIEYFRAYGGSTNLVHHEFFRGTLDQPVSNNISQEIPAWNEAMRGTAYSYFCLIYNDTAWKSIPEITAIIKGRKIYDPRNGDTLWSRNPALVWRDFLTSTKYGLGVPTSAIDDDSVVSAANWCDSNSFYFDGVIMDRQAFLDNFQDIMMNFRAFTIWSEGKYRLKIYTDDSPVMALTETDVEINPESFKVKIPGIPETPSKIKCIFPDKANNYTANWASWEDLAAISYSGDPNEKEITLVGTTDFSQAKKLAKYQLIRNQKNKEFSILAHPRCYALEPGDSITVTHEFLDWDSKKVRVGDVGFPQEGMVPLRLIEEDSSIYDLTI